MRSLCIAIPVSLIITGAAAQSFLPPGWINAGADNDTQVDWWPSHLIDADGHYHAVWASPVDYTGNAGGDFDIYYSQNDGTGWSAPELVNSYGELDTLDEWLPRIAQTPDGTLHCVWQSNDNYQGSGNDWDIFHAEHSASGWGTAQIVNSDGLTDQTTGLADDMFPSIVVTRDGNLLATWQSSYALSPPTIGNDRDILVSVYGGTTWTAATWLNSNATTDTGDDDGPVALALKEDGELIAVWSTDDDFRLFDPVGNDRDIVMATLPPGGSWSDLREINALARADTGLDRNPSVVTFGSGASEEVHIVWESDENYLPYAVGNDTDIFHTFIGPLQILPTMNLTNIVNSTAFIDGPLGDDITPKICIDAAGVLNCVWVSSVDLGGGATGLDRDLHHSINPTNGTAWTAPQIANLNGLAVFDGGLGADQSPDLVADPDGTLSLAWHSDDALGGALGNDDDILHAVGLGRGVTRPDLINMTGGFDGPAANTDFDWVPAMAFAPDGTLHAVWASDNPNIPAGNPPQPTGNDHDIFHAVYQGFLWSQPELVNTNGIQDTGDEFAPDIAFDAQGDAHVVWSSDGNIGGTVGTDWDLFYSVKTGGTWSAPEIVNSGATADSGVFAGDDGPRIAINASDEVHVVWASNHFVGLPGAGNISHAVRTSSGWSAEVYVNAPMAQPSPNDENVDFDLVLDRQGRPHVVWSGNSNWQSAGIDYDVFHTVYDGGAWSTPEFINDAANDGVDDTGPAAAFNASGELHAVWSSALNVQGAGGDSDIVIAKRTAGTWGQAQLLSLLGTLDNAVGSIDEDPEIAFDRLGRLHVLWRSTHDLLGTAATDGDLFYTVLPRGGALPSPAPVVLANNVGQTDGAFDVEFGHRIVMAPDGRPHFCWSSGYDMGATMGQDEDCYHASAIAYVTLEDLVRHLLGKTTLRNERLALCDRNRDGSVDIADVVSWIRNP